jgi:hypothetical protein
METAHKRRRIRQLLKGPNKKKLFWAWVAYQALKGTTTMAVIWIPLIYAWLHLR